jgi:hypothetical protein
MADWSAEAATATVATRTVAAMAAVRLRVIVVFLLELKCMNSTRGKAMSTSSADTARDADSVSYHVGDNSRHLPKAGDRKTYQATHVIFSLLSVQICQTQRDSATNLVQRAKNARYAFMVW